MGKPGSRCRWTAVLVIVACTSMQAIYAAPGGSRNLNPYHQQQLDNQIRECASAVVACTTADERVKKQQELCQLLIRAERYDDAVQVAYNIYQSEDRQTERRAAYHFLVAEIYNRKMQSATTALEMEEARKAALETAQQVIDQSYPAKWHVAQYARDLVKDLNDADKMARVKQRLATRQGSGDVTREAIADAQRRYLDATQGGGSAPVRASSGGSRMPSVESNSRYVSAPPMAAGSQTVTAAGSEMSSLPSLSGGQNVSAVPGSNPAPVMMNRTVDSPALGATASLPSEPTVSRVISPLQRLTDGEQQAMSRIGASGLLTSQPGLDAAGGGDEMAKTTIQTQQQPLLVNGQPAQGQHMSPEEIRQNNLSHLLDAAKRRRENDRHSPYASGQLPEVK